MWRDVHIEMHSDDTVEFQLKKGGCGILEKKAFA